MRVKIVVLSIVLVFISLRAERSRIESRDEYSKISYEHIRNLPADSSLAGSDTKMNNLWVYAGLPGLKIGPRYLFSSVEADIVVRSIELNGNAIGGTVLQRYGLFFGYPFVKGDSHTGAFMVGTGIASDMSKLNRDDLFVNLIYDHRFDISSKLTLGIGVLVSHNLGRFKKPPINLLPTIRWQPNEYFLLHAAWDNLSLKVAPWKRVTLVSETRYDLSYFNLEHYSYQYESVSTGGGADIAVGKKLLLKTRVLKTIFVDESFWSDLMDHSYRATGRDTGLALRMELAYLR